LYLALLATFYVVEKAFGILEREAKKNQNRAKSEAIRVSPEVLVVREI